jgi:hypothetical protein
MMELIIDLSMACLAAAFLAFRAATAAGSFTMNCATCFVMVRTISSTIFFFFFLGL